MHWEKNNFYYSKLTSLYKGGPKRSAGKKTLQKPHRWGFYVVFDIIRGPAKRGGLFLIKICSRAPVRPIFGNILIKKIFFHYFFIITMQSCLVTSG